MSDKHLSNVVLLVGFEGADGSTTFIDESPSGRTLTANGNAQIDTAQFKYGTSSGLFDGNGDFVTAADSAHWSFDSSPFTVEGWMRFNSRNTAERGGCLVAHYANTSNQRSWGLYYNNDSGQEALTFIRSSNGSATLVTTGNWPGGAPTLGVWYHVAADRDASNVLRVYVNGTVLQSESIGSFSFHNSTDTLSIGRLNSTSGFRRWMAGWIDEVRVTKDVARYGGNFRPPQGPFSRYKALGVARAARPATIGTALAA